MKKTNALRILDRHKVVYEVLSYDYDPESLSLNKIAKENGLAIKDVYKTLVAKGDKTGIIVALVAGHRTINLKSLAKVSGNKKIALVAVKELLGLTGYIRGGCSPIGMKKQFPVYIDEGATSLEKLCVNAGVRGTLVKLSLDDLVRVTKATIADLAVVE